VPRRLGRSAALLTVIALLSGCSLAQDAVDEATRVAQEAANEATSAAANAAIEAAIGRELGRLGLRLDGTPDCTSDLQADGVALTAEGTITCTGRTTKGGTVDAVFTGTLSPTSCIGALTVDVDGRREVDVPRVDGCRIAQVLGGIGEGAQS
jgi:hypothetical protein